MMLWEGDQMSAEDLEDRIRCVLERAYGSGDLEALDGLYAADAVCHRPPLPDVRGLSTLKESVADLRSAFSVIELTMERVIFEGDVHAALWTFRATHTGQSPVMPIPPTHRMVSVTGSTMCLWAGSGIVEEWSHVNWLGLFRQLGVIPPMG
jgi:predicted ester cyclase